MLGVRLVGSASTVVLAVGLLSLPSVRAVDPAPASTATTVAREPALPALSDVVAPPTDPGVPLAEAVLPDAATAPAPDVVSPVLAPVPPAPPAPVPPALEQRALSALSALDYPWRELGYDLRFQLHRGGRLLGLTDPRTRTITVFVRPTQSEQSLRVTLAHEIGHALDLETGGSEQRARYLELRGLPADTPWFPCDGCSDDASGAGDWAEVFAYWLAGAGDFRSRLAGPPDDEALTRITELFAPPAQRAPDRRAPVQAEPSEPPAPEPSRSPRPLLPLGPGR